ncbi:MAG: outer membrane beta-barrel protein [Bacteroidales bacterium]
MKTLRNIILISFIAIILIPVRSFTQTINPEEYNTWSVGVKYGILPFYGDVRQLKYSTDNKYRKTNGGFALEGIKNFNEIFGAKLQLITGKLSGSSPNLNLHFNSSVFEGSLSGMVNLNNLISYYPEKDKIINTYLFAGFGIIKYRSAVRSFDEDAFITGYAWDSFGYSKTTLESALSFPFGIGIKFKADTRFDVGFEFSLHLTNTDKLDAWVVENSYNDRFSYASISFTYKIGNKKEYVDWVNPFNDTANANVLHARNNIAVNDNTTISM